MANVGNPKHRHDSNQVKLNQGKQKKLWKFQTLNVYGEVLKFIQSEEKMKEKTQFTNK